jgi:sensor c-di-GMP phosphodiesterase-like protein
MQHLADERLHIEKRLREAIKSRDFFVHYQPQVDSYGLLVGAEALIRWEDEHGKMVPPDLFIPVAEEIGIITAIGDQVLHQVCSQFREWLDSGLKIPHISVNISAKQFHQDSFVGTVCQIIGQYDLKPPQIYLEITETAMLGNREEIIQKITNLRNLGFAVSIDDFGTGYSSLNYLKHLPIDQLKIDKSFIHGIGQNEDDSAIVNMIISMAVHLKVDLIAEGVEDKHQFYYLKQNGCYAYQGYFVGKPLAPEAFKRFAEEHDIALASSL